MRDTPLRIQLRQITAVEYRIEKKTTFLCVGGTADEPGAMYPLTPEETIAVMFYLRGLADSEIPPHRPWRFLRLPNLTIEAADREGKKEGRWDLSTWEDLRGWARRIEYRGTIPVESPLQHIDGVYYYHRHRFLLEVKDHAVEYGKMHVVSLKEMLTPLPPGDPDVAFILQRLKALYDTKLLEATFGEERPIYSLSLSNANIDIKVAQLQLKSIEALIKQLEK